MGLTLGRDQYPDGFFLTFTANGGRVCDDYSPVIGAKEVKFRLTKDLTRSHFKSAIISVISCLFVCYVSVFVTCCFLWGKDGMNRDVLVSDVETVSAPSSGGNEEVQSVRADDRHHGHRGDRGLVETILKQQQQQMRQDPGTSTSFANAVVPYQAEEREEEQAVVEESIVESEAVQTEALIVTPIQNLPRQKVLKSGWLQALLAGSFLTVPVLKLGMNTYSFSLSNQDVCFKNFLCAYNFAGINNFNHVFSNIGYVLLGVLILLISVQGKTARLRGDKK